MLVMEYAPRGDLGMFWTQRPGHLEVGIMLKQNLQALSYLPRNNITHRDIKPQNILVHTTQPLVTKLSDFGMSTEASLSKTFCGSLSYLAPEGYAAKKNRGKKGGYRWYDQAVDVWSLGVVGLQYSFGLPTSGIGEQRCRNTNRHAYRQQGPIAEVLQQMLQLNSEKRPSADEALTRLDCTLPQLDQKGWNLKAVQSNRSESSTLAFKRLYEDISENDPAHNPRRPNAQAPIEVQNRQPFRQRTGGLDLGNTLNADSSDNEREQVTHPPARRAIKPGFFKPEHRIKDSEVVQVPIEHEVGVRHQELEKGTSDTKQSEQRQESLIDHPEQESEHDTHLRHKELESDTSDSNLSEQSQRTLIDLHEQLEHEETEYESSSLGSFVPGTGSKVDAKQSRHSMYSEPSYSHGSYLPRMKDSFLDQLRSDTRVQPHHTQPPHYEPRDQQDNESFSILQNEYPALPLQKGEKMRYISDSHEI